ncbi:MAG: phytoene/squalene synthase family protein [Vulcanimicrobiota bacterium]
MISLADSYRHCRQVTKERAKNFYYGIRLLPSQRQDALCAVYAFFRYCDDVSDDEIVGDRDELLTRWRASVEPGQQADSSPILPAFHETVQRYAIPTRYFRELIDGAEADLSVSRYQTFEELYRYCYQVASTVGLVCIHIFGFDGSDEAFAEAEARGIAFQMTNILRDISEDAERGRIYLPLEDLERFEVKPADLLAGNPGPGFARLLAFEVERARGYYEKSEPLVERVDSVSRPSLVAMTRIYRGLLERIAQMGPRVLKERASLNKLEKIKLAGEGFFQSLRA